MRRLLLLLSLICLQAQPARAATAQQVSQLIVTWIPDPQPITWHTYYKQILYSPITQQIFKATSIALGASVRGYYMFTIGIGSRYKANGDIYFIPNVQGF
jgi:hypothetical protein